MVGEAVAVATPGAGASTSLAMVAAGTHTARHRAGSISIWAAALSFGGTISSVLGGLVAKAHFGSDPNAGWRWAFVVVAVLALASIVVAADDSSAPVGRSLDWPGQVTIAVALFSLLFAVVQGPTSGWGCGEVVAGFIVAAVFAAAFILAERRAAAPLLRLDLFANRAFAAAAAVTVLAMFAFLGMAYATSIRLSAIQGSSPRKTSVAFLFLNGMALLLLPSPRG